MSDPEPPHTPTAPHTFAEMLATHPDLVRTPAGIRLYAYHYDIVRLSVTALLATALAAVSALAGAWVFGVVFVCMAVASAVLLVATYLRGP